MSEKKISIDSDFERLIPHLSQEELEILEKSLIEEGCREPIYVWNDVILDGHNRYRICTKHGIPYKVVNAPVSSKDEAIVWICINQMGRRNISEQTRHYLIGKRYEAEKRIGASNPFGKNQYTGKKGKKEDTPLNEGQPQKLAREAYTSGKVGKEYGIGHNAVEKYGRFARNIDRIEQAAPELADKLLKGQLFISMDNVNEISQMSDKQIRRVSDTIVPIANGHVQREQIIESLGHQNTRQKVVRSPSGRDNQVLGSQTVKTAPAYDPDSEISSLTLTVPTWIIAMNRTVEMTNMDIITEKARNALRVELVALRGAIDSLLKRV